MEPIVIHTPTLQDAQALFKVLDQMGYRWNDTTVLRDETTAWIGYREETCYELTKNHTILYGRRSDWSLPSQHILSFDEGMALLCDTGDPGNVSDLGSLL